MSSGPANALNLQPIHTYQVLVYSPASAVATAQYPGTLELSVFMHAGGCFGDGGVLPH
jgi:hypothetical protein